MCHCCDCITLSPKTCHAHTVSISTLRTKLLKFSNIKKIFEKSENFLMYLKKMLYYQDIFIYMSDTVLGPALMAEWSKARPHGWMVQGTPLWLNGPRHALMAEWSKALPLAVSHHCLGWNLVGGMWESCQWPGVRWLFSLVCPVFSTIYNWLVTY